MLAGDLQNGKGKMGRNIPPPRDIKGYLEMGKCESSPLSRKNRLLFLPEMKWPLTKRKEKGGKKGKKMPTHPRDSVAQPKNHS